MSEIGLADTLRRRLHHRRRFLAGSTQIDATTVAGIAEPCPSASTRHVWQSIDGEALAVWSP
jgi:hypothetical protein